MIKRVDNWFVKSFLIGALIAIPVDLVVMKTEPSEGLVALIVIALYPVLTLITIHYYEASRDRSS